MDEAERIFRLQQPQRGPNVIMVIIPEHVWPQPLMGRCEDERSWDSLL